MNIHISVELSHVCPLEEITEHAAALESLGYYRVWVPDTIVSPWEAWLAAGLIVQHTTHLKIGLGVTNPYTRHPMVVAHDRESPWALSCIQNRAPPRRDAHGAQQQRAVVG